jgi:hypothetical protein
MAGTFSTDTTWAQHRETGVRLQIEVTSTVVGRLMVWGADVVLERGRREALKGGSVPAGAKLAHQAMLQAARDQAASLPASVILGQGGTNGELFS